MESDLLVCSGCNEKLPRASYTATQLKRKTKRKCKPCAEKALTQDAPKENKDEKKEPKTEEKEKKDKKQVSKGADSSGDSIEKLLKWLKDNGATFPRLTVETYGSENRGVHTNSAIPATTIVLEVPLKCIITGELARESEIGQKIIKSGVKLRSEQSILAAFLVQEKRKADSFFKPYIESLPQNYDTMPIRWNASELKYLKGSFMLALIQERKNSLKQEYDNICKAVDKFSEFSTLDEFVWGRLSVISRLFELKLNGKSTEGLVPFADLINHKIPQDVTWTFNEGKKVFFVQAMKRLFKGAQIFDSYGPKCNSRFLLNYGFCVENNSEYNTVPFSLALNKADPNYTFKSRSLGAKNLTQVYQVSTDYKDKQTRECMSYLRFCMADGKDLIVLSLSKKKEEKSQELIGALTPQNEAKVIAELGRLSTAALSQFPNSIEEDAEILKGKKPLTTNQRHAVMMRKGEKEVYQYFAELHKEVESFAKMDWAIFKTYVTKYTGKGKFDGYINDVWRPLIKMAATVDEIVSKQLAAKETPQT